MTDRHADDSAISGSAAHSFLVGDVPSFNIGQIEDVRPYVESVLPSLAQRLALSPGDAAEMHRLFLASLDAATVALPQYMEEAFAPAIPEGRELFDWLGQTLIDPTACTIEGMENVVEARRLQAGGANIMMMSNHTSGADHPATEWAINSALGAGSTHNWLYMSGHVVNYFLVPLMLSGGIHRFQIVSVRYQEVASKRTDDRLAWMRARNRAAIIALMRRVATGGKWIVMYPEGGRGDGALKEGEPRTMTVPQVVADLGPDLYIVPVYVEAASILPPDRRFGEAEFTAVLHLARRGGATVKFGKPVAWRDLQPCNDTDLCLPPGCDRRAHKAALKQFLLTQVMSRIAEMAPTEAAKGPWAASEMS